jgi:purine-nucleoside phosphorylase
MKIYEKLEKCLACVRKQTDFVPDVAIILGSGLGALADEIKAEAVVEYSSIEGFPVSTVPGHKGRFVFGTFTSKEAATYCIDWMYGYISQGTMIL